MTRQPTRTTPGRKLFPYTTLFRSHEKAKEIINECNIKIELVDDEKINANTSDKLDTSNNSIFIIIISKGKYH